MYLGSRWNEAGTVWMGTRKKEEWTEEDEKERETQMQEEENEEKDEEEEDMENMRDRARKGEQRAQVSRAQRAT